MYEFGTLTVAWHSQHASGFAHLGLSAFAQALQDRAVSIFFEKPLS
jgi:hypothetical protein